MSTVAEMVAAGQSAIVGKVIVVVVVAGIAGLPGRSWHRLMGYRIDCWSLGNHSVGPGIHTCPAEESRCCQTEGIAADWAAWIVGHTGYSCRQESRLKLSALAAAADQKVRAVAAAVVAGQMDSESDCRLQDH